MEICSRAAFEEVLPSAVNRAKNANGVFQQIKQN